MTSAPHHPGRAAQRAPAPIVPVGAGCPRDVAAELRDAVAPVADGLLPGTPVDKVVRVLEAWTTLVGIVSLEVFGHWRNTVLDPGAFFEATMRDLADLIGLRASPSGLPR